MKGDMAEKQQALVTMINQSPDEIQERARAYQAERGAEMSQPVITALIDELETEKADVQRNLDSTTRVNQSVITAYQEREAKVGRS
jgi:DNA-binding ferritin-like protein